STRNLLSGISPSLFSNADWNSIRLILKTEDRHFTSRNFPSIFSHADWSSIRLGLQTKRTVPHYMRGYTMYLNGEWIQDTYGRLVSWERDRMAITKYHRGIAPDPRLGVKIETDVLHFLVRCNTMKLVNLNRRTKPEQATSLVHSPVFDGLRNTDSRQTSHIETLEEDVSSKDLEIQQHLQTIGDLQPKNDALPLLVISAQKSQLQTDFTATHNELLRAKGEVTNLQVQITEIEDRTPGEAPKETTNGSGDSLAVRNREPLDRESSEDSVGSQPSNDAAARFGRKRTRRAALDAAEKPASKRIKTTANQSAILHLSASSASETQAYITNLSDKEQDPNRDDGRQRKRRTTQRAAAMPIMVKKPRAKAGKTERPPITHENKNSDPEPWITIDQFRQTTFVYGDLPQTLFDLVR
ncbi:MAG: hypothetical protein L6R42_000991, partial [Xanthoria sp. 1 TBL-2021]